MPELARDFQVVAVDQRGIGLSDKPPDGYDTGTLASDLVALMVVGEGPLPGVAPSPPLFLPGPLNERLWHIGFNRTAEVNERLVKGREDISDGCDGAPVARP